MSKYGLTNPQKSIWVTEEFYKGTSIENIAGYTTINEKVDFGKLKEAINLFIKNTESFRLKFVNENNKILQYISDYEEQDFEVVLVESEKDVKQLENEFAYTPLKIFDTYLFKFKLFKYKDGHGGFFVVGHHMFVDAWACGLVISTILSIYTSLVEGKNYEEEQFSYIDYIKSEEEYLSGKKFEKDKAFWNEEFTNVPEPATIPGSLKDSKISSKARRKQFKIPAETMNLINVYCKENKISPFNFFMGAYSLYLSRVTNLDEFVIGTPILNRSNIKEKHTIGMFISVVPFKVNINQEKSFTEFASQISSNFFNIFRHQKYPYQLLLEDLRKQNPGIPNLYNVLLSYQNMRTDTKNTDINYETQWLFNGNISEDMEIHFFDINDSGIINVAYDYKTSKYTTDDIYLLHSRLLHIMNQILDNNSVLLKDIEIVTPDEKEELLYGFNKTEAKYPKDKTISQLFEEQATKTPDAVALVFEDQELTYQELNERANSLANYLRKKGVGPDDLIGVMVNRSLEMIVSLLAVLKAGGAYIPIDPSYPKERVEYMLKNSCAKLLLTQEHLKDKVDFKNKIFVDLSNTSIYSLPRVNLENINDPENLSYVIFTSGSTGLPKGVMLKHKALSNLTAYCNSYIEYLKHPSNLAVVSITTVSFDIFIFETLISLQKGLKLVIANENEQTIPDMLGRLILKHDVKIMQSTPSRMQLILNNLSDFTSIENLDYITLAGEQLPLALVNKLHQLSKITIYNGYGPSETTVFSTLTKMDDQIITIGQPLFNTQIYILDKCLMPVPVGVSGEIYIAGDGVGRGYLNRQDLTDKAFINNPFIPNTIMYKTGDLGMFCSDGKILCLGRSDNQIKIRGLRIELGEIEEKLSEIPDVKACAVVKKVDDSTHEFLCAYYTSEDDEIPVSQIRKHLQKYLPDYMVPQYFTKMDNLPYTPNGKIDAKKLPMPEVKVEKKKIILPRNDIDKKLIDILKELLNVSAISIDDNFFELGGDSLSAINLCTQIQNEFNCQVFVKDILEKPIVQNLSDAISNIINSVKKETITPVAKAEFYEVSSAQKRMYFASQMAGDNSILYNIPGGFVLDGKVDIAKLEKCLKALINRHESLRTYFELHNDNVVQKIKNNIDFKLEIIKDKEIDDLNSIFVDLIKPFDLSKAPLFRAKLITFKSGQSSLFVDMHHIISDGTSLSILVDELCKLYNDEQLPELNITYKDYAEFENGKINSGALKEAENYWLRQFENDLPILNLPTQHPRPNVQSFEGKRINTIINQETMNKIIDLANELEVTPYMIMFACYYILLSKYSSQEDIVVGTPIVARDIVDTYSLIGMFVNSLAIRENINSKLTFKELILNLRRHLLSSYKYQTYPFDELVAKLNIKRDTSRNPLFDTMFVYQNNGFRPMHFNGVKSEYFIPDTHISKFDLSLEVIPTENGAKLSFEYATKLFDEDFIIAMKEHYLNIIDTVLNDNTITIGNLNMLSEAEKDIILNHFNNTKTNYPKNKTIAQIFEEQVKQTPDKTAIVFENKKLTYSQLNEKANSLANYLRDNDITRGDVVGIKVNRSLELIVSIMAVLKAGGMYTLIDNNLPDARVDYILDNCKAKILLVDSMYDFEDIDVVNVSSIDYEKNTKSLSNINEPTDDFAIIYTSGSTGNPKGVLLHNQGFVNLVYSFKDVLDLKSSKKHLGFASVSFDMFAVELFSSLLLGRTLYLLNDEEMKNPVLISDIIIKNNIDYLICTPTKIELLLANENTTKCLKCLRGLQLGGEVFTADLYKRLSAVTDATIHNGYGPTEITACCSDKTVTSENDINIGSPISNTKIYILDKNSNLCPINVPGELCVAGVGISHGYINDAKKTSKVFVQSKFSNEILYKTGDIAYYKSNGDLVYIGRTDFQVKINGLRIELSEIEKKLKGISDIKSCVVMADKTKTYIKAFFTSDSTLSIPAIRKTLGETLPQFMIPKIIMQIDSIPMTNNGKIDRAILDDLTSYATNGGIEYIAPENELQKKFCDIWENILGTKVGIDNDLFELGADSLTAIKFKVEALNEGIDIPYADIFKLKTIRNLSESKAEEVVTTPIENFEYSDINNLLKKNKTQLNYKFEINMNNNVLLLGSNGFVGMHIIDSFIKNDTGIIYCLMRDKNGKGALNRFLEVLHFYFGNTLDSYIGNRIVVLKGDVLKEDFGLSQRNYSKIIDDVSVIINTAANVKHFGDFNKFKNINIDSIRRAIDFCKKHSKKLIHISTLSISGNMFLDNTVSKDKLTNEKKVFFTERNLFINQSLDNVYTRSKFEAEKIILENIASGNIDGLVLRLGNITSRYSDGRFQINPEENAFTSRLKSFVALGVIPKSLLRKEIEFTPVDICADAIIKCLQYNHKSTSVLHIYNRNHVKTNSIVDALKDFNINIKVLNDKDFAEYINNSLANKNTKKYINGIINDLNSEKQLVYDSNIYVKSDFSVQYLLHCKFRWVKINKEYIIKYITYLKSIGFFNN